MSICLPKEAERHVDPTSTLNSVRNLTDAIERGELPMSALASFMKAVGSGETPKFAKMRPVPLDMIRAIQENPDRLPRQVVYSGVASGRWTMDDAAAYEENAEVIQARQKRNAAATRGVYLTRKRRGKPYKPSTDKRFAKIAIDAILREGLCDGAVKCLGIIVALAGKASEITTYTSALASTLKKTTRTVRNYFMQLEEAGLITRRPGKQYNTVHLRLHPDCKPEAFEEPNDLKAFKLARKSSDPGLHLMAMTVVMASMDVHQESFATSDRRKEISVFNLESNSLMSRMGLGVSGNNPASGKRTAGSGELVAPTTHSTLLVDPRKPLQGRRPYRRASEWVAPTGFNRISAF